MREDLGNWLARASSSLATLLEAQSDRGQRIYQYASPSELEHVFDGFSLGEKVDAETLDRLLEQTLQHSVKTAHPRFFNQNFAGADPVAVLGDWLTALLNTTAATYEMAPVFTLMERALTEYVLNLAGIPNGGGMMVAGGTLANLFALQMARTQRFPEVKRGGQGSLPPLAVFTSQGSHYSIEKSLAVLGMGTDALFKVPTHPTGGMDLEALSCAVDEARRDGRVPFFVNATAGTTVRGSFDPFEAIAGVCHEHDMWMHVDGAFGASVYFSDRERGRMRGAERASSMSWNLHKMAGATQQCSVLLLKDASLPAKTFSSGADYIFQKDKANADYDTGDATLHCGRRPDAVKGWLMLKARGDTYMAERIESAVDRAAYLRDQIAKSGGVFRESAFTNFVCVCFWWVPPALRAKAVWDDEDKALVHLLAPRIKERMQQEGRTLIGYQPVLEGPNSFRWLFINPEVGDEDIDDVLALIEQYGQDAMASAGRTP